MRSAKGKPAWLARIIEKREVGDLHYVSQNSEIIQRQEKQLKQYEVGDDGMIRDFETDGEHE